MLYKLSRNLSKTENKEECSVIVSKDMKTLEDMICNKEKRRKLINDSISLDNQECIKIRFCSAVIEYEKCSNNKEKISKGRKIISLFIHPGSLFEIQNMSKIRVQQLLGQNLSFLTFAKYDVLSELCKNNDLRLILKLKDE